MDMVSALFSGDVTTWLDRQRRDGDELSWWGMGAKALGLSGKADPEIVRQVLCDGVGPDGERLDARCATVAYWVRFRPDSTVRALAAYYETVLEAQRAAVGAALEALEEEVRLGLVGVATERSEDMSNEIVFLASGRYLDGSGWRPLNTPTAVIKTVIPAVLKALAAYHKRLGGELEDAGFEVVYQPSPENYGALVAVV